jgi:hypothetical protein
MKLGLQGQTRTQRQGDFADNFVDLHATLKVGKDDDGPWN